MILLDTQQWVWLNNGNPRLLASVPTRLSAEGGAISALSVWELAMLYEKGRLSSRLPTEATVRAALSLYPLTVVPVDAEIALLSRTLSFNHEDLVVDRFIAATAHRLEDSAHHDRRPSDRIALAEDDQLRGTTPASVFANSASRVRIGRLRALARA